jgi:hypothetical protein
MVGFVLYSFAVFYLCFGVWLTSFIETLLLSRFKDKFKSGTQLGLGLIGVCVLVGKSGAFNLV